MSVKIEYSSIAQCRLEHVWQAFEQIELWPRWDPQAIREVRWVSGEPWTKGAKFSIEMLRPLPFQRTLEVMEVETPNYVHLRGGSGVTVEQFYSFKWKPDEQSTELHTRQEFSGGPFKFLGDAIKPTIEDGIRRLFAGVCAEAGSLTNGEPLAAMQDEPSGQ
jgi:hypothetical protein